MDKEQAKFILQSFRPDGADASDADFAKALQLAAEDRELGEWLADERAADAAFAAALGEVEIPEELRQHILAVMRGENPGKPVVDEAMDNMLFDAMGALQPPTGLRDQILAAMEIQVGQAQDGSAGPRGISTDQGGAGVADVAEVAPAGLFTGWTRVAAIAAALVLGAFVAFQFTATLNPADGLVVSYEVQRHAGGIINASFELDVEETDPEGVNQWLASRDLPTPLSIPARLRSVASLGCKEIRLPGDKRASVVCFHEEGEDPIFLVIVKNEHIRDRSLPTLGEVTTKDCYHCPETKWNVVRWQDNENTYILLAKKEVSRKHELLEYF